MEIDYFYIKPRYQEYIKPFCNEHMSFDKTDSNRRPNIGVVLKGLFNTDFFVPLISKHNNKPLPPNETFLLNEKNGAILNFNLMVPVPPSELSQININAIKNNQTKRYMQSQHREINAHVGTIAKLATNVYLNTLDNSDSAEAKRSNDFILLEKKSLEWERTHPSNKNVKRPKTDLENVNRNLNTYIQAKAKMGESKLTEILTR